MEKILIILNHKLAYEQVKELEQFDFDILYVAEELKKEWEELKEPTHIEKVCEEIIDYSMKNDCKKFVVQGFTPAVVHLLSKVGAENCYYSYSKEFMEQMKRLDGTIKEIPVNRHVGFFNYKTNERLMPSGF